MTITAKVIADSISAAGIRITTFELEYPRFIHSEYMTHRLLSRNAASSRAIPVKDAIKLIRDNPAMPIHWGKNQPGMSAKEELNALILDPSEGRSNAMRDRQTVWEHARNSVVHFAHAYNDAGYHKQIVNRLIEPFSHIKVVCTATEYDNFFYLRNHPDAQPEIQELAKQMWDAREVSQPVLLNPGDWHVPYYCDGYWHKEGNGTPLEDAIAISASCCAQVSYRKLDDSLEKATRIYERLIESKPAHSSPMEHQATPMTTTSLMRMRWEDGITHMRRDGSLWSGNFKGWIQHRQLIPDNACWNYQP